jgi:hypothetical protein
MDETKKKTGACGPTIPRWRAEYPYWWVTFEAGAARFIYAKGEDAAREAAAKLGTVKEIKTLPYPSSASPDGTPAFCHKPNFCAGHTACPQSYSCTE